MNIGEFKRAPNGDLLGSIASVSIDLPRLGLRPTNSNNECAPAFEIMALNVARRWVQVGALWEQESNTTGEVFYQGRLEDPSFSAPLPILLFGNVEDGYRVVWNRPERGNRDMDGNRRRRNRQEEATDDSFPSLGGMGGNARRSGSDDFAGNATEGGQLIDPRELDEEVPF